MSLTNKEVSTTRSAATKGRINLLSVTGTQEMEMSSSEEKVRNVRSVGKTQGTHTMTVVLASDFSLGRTATWPVSAC